MTPQWQVSRSCRGLPCTESLSNTDSQSYLAKHFWSARSRARPSSLYPTGRLGTLNIHTHGLAISLENSKVKAWREKERERFNIKCQAMLKPQGVLLLKELDLRNEEFTRRSINMWRQQSDVNRHQRQQENPH